ncbi:MAG: FAD-dependent oxidoreductase [bacterium]|nr:FAD-dependent oxidoreductase [Acidimicrobiia bacterium]MCY4651122.1 FAD-dependent oxidoreductase [bacterium]
MREEARCVIVGGGAMGVGLLYHLAHEGWTDTVLVEKDELSSGSTWHAAGLVPHFIGSLNMAKVHAYGAELYSRLEEETGHHTGWHGCGAVRLATNPDEADWFKYVHGVLELVGVESHLVGPEEIRKIHPLVDTEGVVVGLHTPNDGWTDPSSATSSMAAGARQLGAEIMRRNRVVDMNQLPDGRWETITEKGRIVSEHVVNAAGHFGPQLAAMIGLDIPIVSVIHHYVVTGAIREVADLDIEVPVLRDPRSSCYTRQEHDGLLIGPYETEGSLSYGMEGIDWDLTFHLLPPDVEKLLPWLDLAARRIPALGEAGIRRVVCGPITHTPDSGLMIGPAPGLKNYWMCVGSSIGICQGPGAGKYLAQWMVHGQTEINVAEMDPRRFGPYAPGDYTHAKAIDEYHEMYQVRMPGEYREAGRPIKKTPLYDTLAAKGAQFQEIYGWERARYFSPDGSAEDYSFRRSSAFGPVGEEVNGVRNRVGVADLTAFTKLEVTGPDAAALLDRLAANRLPSQPGGIRLAHMLTTLGGIEGEVTITRLGDDRFYLNSSIMAEQHDQDWLRQHVPGGGEVTVTDVTNQRGILAVTGPRSRELLQQITGADLTTPAFPWLTGQEIEVAGVPCLALRVSYVGELGWELHHPIEQMPKLYAAIQRAGESLGLIDFGSYAMNVMRIEKAYKAHGFELTTEITPVEADIERFVNYKKEFQGKAATLARRESELAWVLVYGEMDALDADCRGNEPVYGNGTMMGLTTSGAYGYSVGKSLFFAYVHPDYRSSRSEFEIRVMGERRRARVLPGPAWDPRSERLRV